MTRQLQTVATFAQAGPFTQNQLRWWIFQAAHNGLEKSGAIVRVQRRVYIDVTKFEAWIDSQQERSAQAAA